MKNDTERGTLGAWARKERLALGLSVEQVIARLSAIGATVDPAYLRAIESGSKRPRPDSEIVDALATVYKTRPMEPAPAEQGSDLTALIRVVEVQQQQIAALAQTVTALVSRLDAQAREPGPSEWAEATVRSILAALQLDAAGAASAGPRRGGGQG